MALGVDTPIQAARKFEQLAKGMGDLKMETLLQAGLIVKKSVTAELIAVGAGSGRLRGMKRGAKIGVQVAPFGATAVLVRATGPFHLIESNTRAHRIPKQRILRSRKTPVAIPGFGVFDHVDHPGTRGKHPWAKGVAAATPLVGQAHRLALQKTLVSVFR